MKTESIEDFIVPGMLRATLAKLRLSSVSAGAIFGVNHSTLLRAMEISDRGESYRPRLQKQDGYSCGLAAINSMLRDYGFAEVTAEQIGWRLIFGRVVSEEEVNTALENFKRRLYEKEHKNEPEFEGDTVPDFQATIKAWKEERRAA